MPDSLEDLFEEALRTGRTPQELCGSDSQLTARLTALLQAAEAEQNVNQQFRAGRSANAASNPGQVAGSFTLDDLISSGGMGAVFRAHRTDGQYEQDVAVKVLHSHLSTPLLVDHFLRERQFLAELNHPNIVRLLDGGVFPDGRPWLAMELVEGRLLLEYAANLAIAEKLALFKQALDAIEYAHQRSIVHRDLKPANLMVSQTGELKLLDFGTARIAQEEAAEALTMPWLTPAYASPEQLRGERASVLSDCYSLGLILYELATGKRALEENATQAYVRATSGVELPRTGVDSDLDTIIRKATACEPRDRYQSAGALRDDIIRYLNGAPIFARPQTVRYRFSKFVRRRPVLTAVSLLIILSSIAATLYIVREDRLLRRELAVNRKLLDFTMSILSNASPASLSRGDNTRHSTLTVAEALQRASSSIDRSELNPAIEAPLRYWIANLQLDTGDSSALGAHVAALRNLATDAAGRALADHAQCELSLLEGNWREASGQCGAALRYLDGHPNADLPWRGAVLLSLAEAAHLGGDKVRAEALAHEGYLWSSRFFGPQHSLTMMNLAQWAGTLRLLGRYDDAEGALLRLLTIQRSFPKPPFEMVESLELLGLIRGGRPNRTGETEAFEEAEHVLALYEPDGVRCHEIHRYVLSARARNRKDPSAAVEMQRVLAACPLSSDFDRYLAHVAYAEILLNTGDLVKAEEEGRLAVRYVQNSVSRGAGHICFAERILASVLIAEGKRTEEARRLLLSSRNEYLAVSGAANNQSVARIDAQLAALGSAAGKLPRPSDLR